ncbi:hypothetical protein B0T16DRAFT_420782 [Cercophora newfieldiana]|uniref:Uncharacterized protein n=1 Tax=Cercophora newfieldiana TaxID=92897 RepID=A0AA39XY80_9PEZI|nr:hypothetical protein B0T16DRAFT_420782 [Cercophora newfieldiana]
MMLLLSSFGGAFAVVRAPSVIGREQWGVARAPSGNVKLWGFQLVNGFWRVSPNPDAEVGTTLRRDQVLIGTVSSG